MLPWVPEGVRTLVITSLQAPLGCDIFLAMPKGPNHSQAVNRETEKRDSLLLHHGFFLDILGGPPSSNEGV